jgi:hypothetical protein
MTAFDEATAVTPEGEGCYRVRLDERFAIFLPDGVTAAVNGGVLMATVLRAVLDTSPHPHPVATSAHYLRVPRLAPAQVEVAWLKQGRTAATARATLIQEDLPVLETTTTTGSLGQPGEGGLSWTGKPPQLPPIEQCAGFVMRGRVGRVRRLRRADRPAPGPGDDRLAAWRARRCPRDARLFQPA